MVEKFREKRSVVEAAFDLYERLAKDGIECSMTVDDKNGIYTIYSHGVELADDSERINKLFEDMLGEEENDQ